MVADETAARQALAASKGRVSADRGCPRPLLRSAAACLLLVILLLPATQASAQPVGDANCDDVVNVADLEALIRQIFDDTEPCAWADVNGDGQISAADLVALLPLIPEPLPTVTGTPPSTPTATQASTATATVTQASTATITGTPPTATNTPSPSRTGTVTRTPTVTRTSTRTQVPPTTRVPTRTITATATRTPTRTGTPTRTVAQTRTPSVTRTPSRTRTITPTSLPRPFGPEITFFGVVRPNKIVLPPVGMENGIPVYQWPVRTGFIVVGEGTPGTSGSALSVGGTMNSLGGISPIVGDRAALQMLSDRPLGDGSPVVCDIGPPPDLGGVPGTTPNDFGPAESVTNAINDFACRFASQTSSANACTLDATGDFRFVDPRTTLQYCTAPAVGVGIALQPGRTILTMQLKDSAGNIGDRRSIIVDIIDPPIAALVARDSPVSGE